MISFIKPLMVYDLRVIDTAYLFVVSNVSDFIQANNRFFINKSPHSNCDKHLLFKTKKALMFGL